MGTVRRGPGRAALLASLSALVLGLTSCSSRPSTSGASSTVTTVPSTATSVASTVVSGTRETGLLAFMGRVERLPVTALSDGSNRADAAQPGTAAYAQVVQVAYRQFGAGKPLVLISGEDATMDWWSPPLLRQLAGHYRVTIFDLPGVGYSGPPNTKMTMDWLGDLAAGLVAELQLESPVVVGWGLGGQVALAMAERHPGLVGDLVLVDTAVPTGSSRPMPSGTARLLGTAPVDPNSLVPLLFTPAERAARRSWLAELTGQIPDNITSTAVTAEASLEERFWRHTDVAERLGSVSAPTLVVWSAEDKVFPPGDSLSLARLIDGAQRYHWNATGYGSLIAEPAHFAQLIEGFTG